jgi:hypothetical protein
MCYSNHIPGKRPIVWYDVDLRPTLHHSTGLPTQSFPFHPAGTYQRSRLHEKSKRQRKRHFQPSEILRRKFAYLIPWKLVDFRKEPLNGHGGRCDVKNENGAPRDLKDERHSCRWPPSHASCCALRPILDGFFFPLLEEEWNSYCTTRDDFVVSKHPSPESPFVKTPLLPRQSSGESSRFNFHLCPQPLIFRNKRVGKASKTLQPHQNFFLQETIFLGPKHETRDTDNTNHVKAIADELTFQQTMTSSMILIFVGAFRILLGDGFFFVGLLMLFLVSTATRLQTASWTDLLRQTVARLDMNMTPASKAYTC